jgi:uncharacterized protein (TIGR02147 family)
MKIESPESRLDYRLILLKEFEQRKQRNPAFSLRAFAKKLEVSPAYLSQIFSRKRNLSLNAGSEFARKLRWTAQRRKLFCSLIEYQRAQGPEAKQEALSQIQNLSELDFMELQRDEFQLISEWYHFAIAELTETTSFRSDPKWIARRLKITPEQAQEATERLLRIQILKEVDGRLQKSTGHYRIQNSVSPAAMQAFHSHHLKSAQTALDRQSSEVRDFSGTTVAVDLAKLPEIKDLIRDFRKQLNQLCSQNSKPQAVYQLSVQFFRLDKETL